MSEFHCLISKPAPRSFACICGESYRRRPQRLCRSHGWHVGALPSSRSLGMPQERKTRQASGDGRGRVPARSAARRRAARGRPGERGARDWPCDRRCRAWHGAVERLGRTDGEVRPVCTVGRTGGVLAQRMGASHEGALRRHHHDDDGRHGGRTTSSRLLGRRRGRRGGV